MMSMITIKRWTHRANDTKTAADIIYNETGDENDYERMIYILGSMLEQKNRRRINYDTRRTAR